MDRTIVYPGSIPLDTDLLNLNRNTMMALGYLAQALIGSGPVVDGLICTPTAPASMQIAIGPGSITQLSVLDTTGYGSLPADTSTPIVKMGINTTPSIFNLSSPLVPGQTNAYIIQAIFQELDVDPVVLPYYNSTNPSQPYSGPLNAGTAQATLRTQQVSLQLKLATSSGSGPAAMPPVDIGWTGLYYILLPYSQTSVGVDDIVRFPTAPFIDWRLPSLRPGFGSGTQSFLSSGTFIVPAGVQQVEVEVWGGGAGSFASYGSLPSGGGSGGGYARKRIVELMPGQSVPITVGSGGSGGTTTGALPSGGGTSSFGGMVGATGGNLNHLATANSPSNGATPAGCGVGGDVNLTGSAGQAGFLNQGGMGGGAPMSGAQNSGTTGVSGVFPGGGAAGAGTGANSESSYDGAAGAPGLIVVRW